MPIEKKNFKSQILINPQEYRIRKNDIAYVICNNHDLALEVQNIKTENDPKIVLYEQNLEYLKKSVGTI